MAWDDEYADALARPRAEVVEADAERERTELRLAELHGEVVERGVGVSRGLARQAAVAWRRWRPWFIAGAVLAVAVPAVAGTLNGLADVRTAWRRISGSTRTRSPRRR